MGAAPIEITPLRRDGTSQAARANADLDPGTIGIDERSTRDLLAFAKQHAANLLYYDEQNRQAGTWAGFFADIVDDDVVAFLDRPQDFPAGRNRPLRRPHFVLFLAWLHLLGIARDAMNGLSQRHLDFYFRDVLRLEPKPAVADRVFVLFDLADGVDAAAIAEGTPLAAGRDSAGHDRIYSTERALIVNRAQVAQLSSLFIDKRITGLAEARTASTGTKEDNFIAMLSLALGDPMPGDPLPPFALKPADTPTPVDYPRLQAFASLVEFAKSAPATPATLCLWLELFELRQLIARKRSRDHADADWQTINDILRIAGRAKRNDQSWTFNPADPRDFTANLATALEGTPDYAHLGLSEVQTIDDLYTQRYLQPVQKAINDDLFLGVDDFVKMMDLKRAADNDWRIVNSLLELAGQRKRKDQSYHLAPANPADFSANLQAAIGDFSANLQAALGTVDFAAFGVADIDGYANAITALESYFFMPAEQFDAVMSVAERPETQVQAREWDSIYGYLAEAHRQKVFAGRRAVLRQLREAGSPPASDANGLRAILAMALGEKTTNDSTDVMLDDLTGLTSTDDSATLRALAAQTAASVAVSSVQWEQAYDILERAQRKREQLPDPLARKEEWRNLYAYADATAVQAQAAAARADEPARWKTFGAAPPAPSPNAPPPRVLGLAIASPLFALSAGDRQIVVTLGFHDDGGGTLQPLVDKPLADTALAVEVTTAKGWTEPAGLEASAVYYASQPGVAKVPPELLGLSFRLTLPASAAPIDAPPLDQRFTGCPWPMVRITLRPVWNDKEKCFFVPYASRLRGLTLARVNLRSAVGSYVDPTPPDATPVAPLVLENDDGPLDGKRPFEPFGAAPAAGATLALSHPDLLRKSLHSLRLRLAWMGGSADLDALYAPYAIGPFTVTITQVDNGVFVTPLASATALFAVNAKTNQQDATNNQDATNKQSATTKQDATVPLVIDIPTMGGEWQPYAIPDPAPLDPLVTAWPRYLRWELGVGFGHQEYPALVAQKTLALAADTANLAAAKSTPATDPTGKSTAEIHPTDYMVSPPYTPKLKSLSLDFVAGHEVLMENYQPGPASDQIFHAHPFGYEEAAPGQSFPFLPPYDNEGELYIGIADLRPPQTLSVLFQMAEGSANPDADSGPVQWSILDADGWRPLGGEAILREDTRGLINSGIIEFALPQAAPDTRLPAGFYWLRASVEAGASGVCDAVTIEAQATSARYVEDGGAPDHYQTPLPAFSISAPATPLPDIASVRQPYTSFGARAAEEASGFYTAASERLRHKQRAVTPWDYERLVLRQFPELYKVKCIPATLVDDPLTGAIGGLGVVRLIVIPDIRNKSLFDPFEPKAPSSLLADIAGYLAPLMPDTAQLEVANAAFVQVSVRVGVRFVDQNNPDFNKQRLNDELNRYLAPWAYDDGADIVIGQRIYANSLVNFIDERSYVDYVAGIKLFWSADGENFQRVTPGDTEDDEYVSSDRPDAVLVAARQHVIDLIVDEVYQQEVFKGVNYMKIELDFVVA
jgi:hypothetical protein